MLITNQFTAQCPSSSSCSYSYTVKLTSAIKSSDKFLMELEIHPRTTGCHLPYGTTQYYLPPNTSKHLNHSQWRQVLDLPTPEDGRLSWPRCYDYSVSKKNPPCSFLTFFPKQLRIFNQFSYRPIIWSFIH